MLNVRQGLLVERHGNQPGMDPAKHYLTVYISLRMRHPEGCSNPMFLASVKNLYGAHGKACSHDYVITTYYLYSLV